MLCSAHPLSPLGLLKNVRFVEYAYNIIFKILDVFRTACGRPRRHAQTSILSQTRAPFSGGCKNLIGDEFCTTFRKTVDNIILRINILCRIWHCIVLQCISATRLNRNMEGKRCHYRLIILTRAIYRAYTATQSYEYTLYIILYIIYYEFFFFALGRIMQNTTAYVPTYMYVYGIIKRGWFLPRAIDTRYSRRRRCVYLRTK